MKAFAIIVSCVASRGAASALAPGSVAGKYNGAITVQTNRGPEDIGITLVIANVQDGKFTGTVTYQKGPCQGDLPVEGGVKGDQIGMRATAKGGKGGDCGFGFKGKVEGTKLVGNLGKYELELRK